MPENKYCNCPNGMVWLYNAVICPEAADEMTNSIGLNQMVPLWAVWSGSALFSQTYLSHNLKFLQHLSVPIL